jgi:hypothetical protein
MRLQLREWVCTAAILLLVSACSPPLEIASNPRTDPRPGRIDFALEPDSPGKLWIRRAAPGVVIAAFGVTHHVGPSSDLEFDGSLAVPIPPTALVDAATPLQSQPRHGDLDDIDLGICTVTATAPRFGTSSERKVPCKATFGILFSLFRGVTKHPVRLRGEPEATKVVEKPRSVFLLPMPGNVAKLLGSGKTFGDVDWVILPTEHSAEPTLIDCGSYRTDAFVGPVGPIHVQLKVHSTTFTVYDRRTGHTLKTQILSGKRTCPEKTTVELIHSNPEITEVVTWAESLL